MTSTYRIIFKSGREVRAEVPQILDMEGDFRIYDKTNKVIGFVCKEDISYIQKIFIKGDGDNEKSKNTT